MGEVKIITAEQQSDFASAKKLFQAYADSLDYSIEYQGFSSEMARFPDGYKLILLAALNGQPVGAVGLKESDGDKVCEMKRMFVEPAGRGRNIGRLLAERLIQQAKTLGYKTMLLDTLQRWKPAYSLYQSLGFTETEPFEHFPQPDVVYMKLLL
ncbi:GNAT family N-acetyltransferase [Kordiimonas aquimaris]|uniref:GNAT family N-acetyltransferase n=1 Tax=Kordiimonas aquimaris TaxID=707591 RepID=UPI0021CE5D51|nr:GNAT family N-acetyltransferase [Kordiimonas aquimaris]